ncbi:MAG: SpoIIE family protein phosphatase [Prevotella sp.]|nr:SpoIIE family protein phosphatase [Prevotella sp.]
MKYRYIHISAALFLIVGMAVQFILSYRQTMHHVQENIDLKTQVAHEKILFELYDAYDVIDLMKRYVTENVSHPDNMTKGTRDLLERYPNFYCLHVDFPEYFYPEKGKWFSPCSYRLNDSITSIITGDSKFDYFQREWYKGALTSGEDGYWGKPYWSDVIDETIFTHSDNMVDKDGNLLCVVGIDFSLSWMQELMEQFKPFDDAVCVIYSTDGKLLTASENLEGQDPSLLTEDHWIVSRQTFEEIDIDMVFAVPQWHIWKTIIWRVLWSFVILIAGILVIGILIHRMLRDQEENARLATEKKVMAREMDIAHGIQMGILRNEFPEDDEVELHADLLPVREVGGDLYDFHRQGDDLWFIIGDVSGKGVPAALFMSAAVNLFRATIGHQTSPKAIMEEMNAVLSENNPSVTFVTAFIGHLHIPSGHLSFCNAGHFPPLAVSREHQVRTIKMAHNIPLGFEGDFNYAEDSCLLGEDELLVLYTDGVTEARNAEKKMLGDQQWMEMVAQGGDLLKAVRQYIGEAEQSDDIALMTIYKKSKKNTNE